MEHLLSITSLVDTDAQGNQLRSELTAIMAEADLGKHSERGNPDRISGKFIALTEEQFLHFKYDPGVEVGFRGMGYEFENIDIEGEFQLRKCCL
jgi:hypothetical protein